MWSLTDNGGDIDEVATAFETELVADTYADCTFETGCKFLVA
jgi:hypothetical protein